MLGTPLNSDLLTYGSAKLSGFGADQGAGAPSVAVPRSTGELGKASPIRRGGRIGEANAQAGSWEDGRRLVEELTERVGGVRAMGRAERSQGEIELAVGDMDVAHGGEQLMQQGSTLLIHAGVVRPQ